MMKKFEEPIIEIITFVTEDILDLSGDENWGGGEWED